MMKCNVCGGQVLWDMPIKPHGPNTTTCTSCQAKNSWLDEDEWEEEHEFECCNDCDLPDACNDHGCAKKQGFPRIDDGIQFEWDD